MNSFHLCWLGLCLVPVITCANPAVHWTSLFNDSHPNHNSGPTISSRNLALLHTAMYDAVNSIQPTHQPYLARVPFSGEAHPEAAAVAAAHTVSTVLYPNFSGAADALLQSFLAGNEATAALTNGFYIGREAARGALAAREADGANTEVPYIPGTEPGKWRRTPPFFRPPVAPHWRYVRPFGIQDVSEFIPPPPPALESPEYAAALNEVKVLGGTASSLRTAYQSETAIFWSDFSYTSMPPGHWHLITIDLIADRQLTLHESLRLLALVSIAQADAAIVSWEAKYRYNLWRPVTAIQRADEDENALTEADPAWDHFLAAPPFPAYVSGHSSFSKASAEVLARFFGSDSITFTATSDSLPGVTRTYNSFAACADEIGLSRIYAGIHFPFDNVGGKRCGRMIGEFVSQNYLLPAAHLPFVVIESARQSNVRLRLHAEPGQKIVVQESADLRKWAPVATNTAVSGGSVLSHLSSNSIQFYRASAEPF